MASVRPSFESRAITTNPTPILNLPNTITFCRIAVLPAFLIAIEKRDLTSARYLFALAAISDALDGTVARWWNSTSSFGAFLDPFADKLLLMSSLIVMAVEGLLPRWFVMVLLSRDGLVVAGYCFLRLLFRGSVTIRPSFLGKTATALQLVCVLGALYQNLPQSEPSLWTGLLFTTSALTACSGLIYICDGALYLRYHHACTPNGQSG